jgi:nucleotide-binding universal stress UspA family protein
MSSIKENGIILIPIDFSKQSLSAIKHSYNLGRHANCKLVIMHVYKSESEINKAELDAIVKQTATESGLTVEGIMEKGDIFERTDKIAEKIGASLIVAGLDAHIKFRSFMSQSTASKFIKNAPCPVLTIRGTAYNPECKNILMPFDLSPESREKVPAVIQLAQYFKAEIRIVSVFDPADQKYENKLLPYMSQVKKFIKQKNLQCTNKSIPAKDVAESIVDYANKNSCDIIVQMNIKDTSFGEMFSGTMSQKMVDISNVPVLTINPMKRADMPLSY